MRIGGAKPTKHQRRVERAMDRWRRARTRTNEARMMNEDPWTIRELEMQEQDLKERAEALIQLVDPDGLRPR